MAPAVRHIIPFTTMRRSNDGRSRRHRTLWDAGEASTINPGSQAMITNKQEKKQVRSSSSSESLRLIVAQSAVGQQSCTDHLPLGQRRSRLTKHRSTYTVLGGGPGAGVRCSETAGRLSAFKSFWFGRVLELLRTSLLCRQRPGDRAAWRCLVRLEKGHTTRGDKLHAL